jgi:hypothetical protein
MIMFRLTNRRGFALPMVVLLSAVLTAALAAAYTMTTTERRVYENQRAQLEAFSVAQDGLDRFLASPTSYGFSAGGAQGSFGPFAMQIAGGTVEVTAQRIKTPPVGSTEQEMWVVRAHAVGAPSGARGSPPGERTVAQLAYWSPGTVQVLSGWTSLTGLRKNGGSGVLSGHDSCHAKPSVAGVAVPNNQYIQNGGSPVPSGSPAIQYLGDTLQTKNAVRIDWEGIINGGSVTPDLTIPTDSWPSTRFSNDPNYYPTIIVRNGESGNFHLPGGGRGLLIIEGNMTINGGDRWEGVLLVGGKLTSNGNNTVLGATVTGLNKKLDEPSELDINAVGNGTKVFRYHSCNVDKAMSRYGSLSVLSNTWSDNWPEY